ncbi:MAG: hypothetical protein COS37_04700 [Anaerolineae bacterium CG03_land_8_20_14_0_80_58_20]|nr:MAG: hypothetical protein COS37_04700 [Anaerolineae bacterium CG03_land_8_20_14_0_80_58_20]
MTDRKKATRESWKKNLPMPETKKRLSVNRCFSQEEFDKISFGLIPQQMEDKWFIFLENLQLNFHRSWTGQCVYQVVFKNDTDGWKIADAWVSRDEKQYRNANDDYDTALLSFLIDNFLLGKNTPFPVPDNLPKDVPKGVYQHGISGTGYPETKVNSNST